MNFEQIAEERLRRIVRYEKAMRRVDREFAKWWADEEGGDVDPLLDAMLAMRKVLRGKV